MRKLKTFLIFLITFGLLTVGACLPQLVAEVNDREYLNQPGSRDMASIALDLSGERHSLTTAGKIDLLRRGKYLSITAKEASMTEAEVNAAVERQMDEYIAAGIFEWFEYSSWLVSPYLCIDPDMPDHYGIFWTVTIINENYPYHSLMVDIDDETGKIYSIRYDLLGSFPMEDVWEQNYSVMDALTHVYLYQLGLLEVQQNVEPNMAYGELDGMVLCGSFFFNDEAYGELGIEFYVTAPGGFWTYFP